MDMAFSTRASSAAQISKSSSVRWIRVNGEKRYPIRFEVGSGTFVIQDRRKIVRPRTIRHESIPIKRKRALQFPFTMAATSVYNEGVLGLRYVSHEHDH